MNHFHKVRTEAVVAGGLWVVFAIWTIGACYVLGYKAEKTTFFYGIPTWILWGVMLPWVAATVANSVFAIFFMADDE